MPATPGTPGTPGSQITAEEGEAVPPPVQTSDAPEGGLLPLLRFPVEVLRFLARNPLQALLFGVLSIMFGLPAWMAHRRRLGLLVARSTVPIAT
ncbi:MAG: hypothetical protein ACRD02_09710 [Acidimicrobiia bacterium]